MNVACDIDGVLAETWGPVHEALRQRGYELDMEKCVATYHGFREELAPLCDDPGAVLADIWWGKDFLATLPFILPSLPGIRQIKGLCKELHVVTARQTEGFPWVVETTRLWLDRYGIDYDQVAFTTDKLGYCREFTCDVIIEDSPRMAEECAAIGIHAILVDYPWNRHVTEGATGIGRGRVTRVETLLEVPAILREAYP
jgi:hypothetical protein